MMTEEAFVYCWTDTKTNMLYVGYHKGMPNDGYVCSSRSMLREYHSRKCGFVRTIIATGSVSDMKSLETAILRSVNAAQDPQFYNLHNNNNTINMTDEVRQKISQRKKGMAVSESTKLKLSVSASIAWKCGKMSGRNSSDWKKSISEAHKNRSPEEKKKSAMKARQTLIDNDFNRFGISRK